MSRILVLLAATACVESDLGMTGFVADDPLVDGFERTAIRAFGEARLQPHGERFDRDEATWFGGSHEVPVVAVGDRVRVAWETGDARVLVWVDPEDLGVWVVAGASGSADPHVPGDDSGVWLDAGVEVEVEAVDGDFAAIRTATRTLEVTAWVSAFDLGPYWVAGDTGIERGPGPQVFLRGGAEILDRPQGEPLAHVAPFGGRHEAVAYVEAELIEERDRHALVELSEHGVTARGWVGEDDWSTRVEGGIGGSSCGGCLVSRGGWGVWPAFDLPAGAELRDAPDGELVGVTTVARGWRFDEATADGWTRIWVPTPWGDAPVWVW